jgi:peptide/nickel transport system ATP-binding protein
MALVLISHDLGVVAEMCDRICVMYAGRIVEEAPSARLFAHPGHRYTAGLIAALPEIDGPRRRLASIPGTVPEPWNLAAGCAFAPRCAEALPCCAAVQPPFRPLGAGHRAACVHAGMATPPTREMRLHEPA